MGVEFNLEPVERKRGRPRKTAVKAAEVVQSKIVMDDGPGECVDYSARNERLKRLFDRLWGAADELRANSSLRSVDYSTPVLGLLFLRYADYRFGQVEKELAGAGGGRRSVGPADYQAKGVLYLTPEAQYEYLLSLPEGADVGRAIDNAMGDIEKHNDELRDVLPKVYAGMESRVLVSLLRTFNFNMEGLEGDVFGKIYEYFLGKFAMAEGQRAGEFFTPTSIVKLIVNVIEPYHGRILDPACGSGGMFVQSAEFVREHRRNPSSEIMIYGQDRVDDTVRLCKMNLAVHGLSGDIRQGNTYYVDHHDSVDRFDFVMANPPFNVNNVDKEAIKDDPRFGLGIPTVDNANYLWIQAFYSALNENGRAGFVMSNQAGNARYSEMDIRKKLIETGVVDVIVSISSQFFYTVSHPVILWFLNKQKMNSNLLCGLNLWR
jgi:type I restriction enzyme M protein